MPLIAPPGWKTPAFWLSLLVLVASAVPLTGVFANGSPVLGMAAALVAGLAALGYDLSRSRAKVLGTVLASKAIWKRTETLVIALSAAMNAMVASGALPSTSPEAKTVAGFVALATVAGFGVNAQKVSAAARKGPVA